MRRQTFAIASITALLLLSGSWLHAGKNSYTISKNMPCLAKKIMASPNNNKNPTEPTDVAPMLPAVFYF